MNHTTDGRPPSSGQQLHHSHHDQNRQVISSDSPTTGPRPGGGMNMYCDVNNLFNSQGYQQISYQDRDEDSLNAHSQYSNNQHNNQHLYRDRREDSLGAHSQYSNNQFRNLSQSSSSNGFTQNSIASTPTSTSISRAPTATSRASTPRTANSRALTREPPTRQSTVDTDDKPGSKQRTNYSDKALLQLCTLWLHVSQNPIIGSDQRCQKFWEKITAHYNQNMDHLSQRSLKSLQSRWSTLNTNMSKFASCVQQIKGLKESGKSHEDQMANALALYKQDCKGIPFREMSSYNFIKNAPKWQENPAYLEHTGNGNSVGSDLDGVDLASDLDALPRMDRPTGNKSAKRGAGKSGLSEEIAPKMLANSSEVALSSRELANQGKEAQATLHKMLDYSILSTNLSSNDEEVRAEFEAERANIICKQRARRAAELGQS